jgi:hypothetical protein
MIFPELQPSPRHPGFGSVTPGIREMFLDRVGLDGAAFGGGVDDARRAFADAVRAMAPTLGADFSELSESQMCDDFHHTIFPSAACGLALSSRCISASRRFAYCTSTTR